MSVHDTGPGIEPDALPQLFQPFERLHAEQGDIEGTGLGLALVKGLTEAMGGRVGVRSEPGRGSTFWIELPASEPPPAVEVRPERPAGHAVTYGTRGTVLYVEDNVSNITLLEHLLDRRPAVRLVTLTDGSRLLEVARTERPNLILLDLHLPGDPGQELLRQLKADDATRDIPVAVLSADATPGRSRQLISAGAVAYLTKPLDVSRTLELIDAHCSNVAER